MVYIFIYLFKGLKCDKFKKPDMILNIVKTKYQNVLFGKNTFI